eukprot:4853312-Alexandrium_andersonii.AAC.1
MPALRRLSDRARRSRCRLRSWAAKRAGCFTRRLCAGAEVAPGTCRSSSHAGIAHPPAWTCTC